MLARFDRARLALLGPPRGTLLDIGAGRGRFVAAARAAGWSAEGVEPSARGVQAARAAYGVVLERAPLAGVSGTYDAISLWHVLEHLDDPDAAVAHVASLLAHGGVLVVGVPNLASVQARIGGARWFHLDLPRHRTHFTPAGLRMLLERHGLAVEREHHVLLEHNPYGLWQSRGQPLHADAVVALQRAEARRAARVLGRADHARAPAARPLLRRRRVALRPRGARRDDRRQGSPSAALSASRSGAPNTTRLRVAT